jgi:hypothetical protein
MGSFRVLVERQRADPIDAEFLSVASSTIRLRALRFSPFLSITIAPHHHENVQFRAARHFWVKRRLGLQKGIIRSAPDAVSLRTIEGLAENQKSRRARRAAD